jgi:alpha-1,2-mannosyltransferase
MAPPAVVVRKPARAWLLYIGLGSLAFLIRLTPLLLGGGLRSYGRYDDGVYYAAADALSFGRVPYRDFVMLHPPGIMLVLTPFAILGRLTSDPVGMTAGRLTFMGIGALNTVLVAMLARRWGWPAALAAATLYACWLPAVYDEQTTLLEPLGGTALLIALLLLLKTQRPPTARAQVIAGVALGLAVTLKIWYVAPFAVVVVWLLISRQKRPAIRVAVGGAIALLTVVLPFAILAPRQMFDMVIRDQLLRPDAASSRVARLSNILGIEAVIRGHHAALGIATWVALALLVVAAVVCWIDQAARLLVVLLAANLFVLLASPSYFAHYASLTAAPGALVLGVAFGKVTTVGHRRHLSVVVFAVTVIAVLATGVRVATRPQDQPFPGAQLARAAPKGCVTSDDPQALIQMNRLSSDLRIGCRVAIDVTGITYDSLHRVTSNGKPVPRADNRAFQTYLYRYLMSGTSFVVARQAGDAMSPAISRALAQQPELAESHGLVLRMGSGDQEK